MAKHFRIQSCTPTKTVVAVICPMHQGEPHMLEMPTKGWDEWTSGTMIQNALPGLSADDRERLITGVCPPCFARMFGDE